MLLEQGKVEAVAAPETLDRLRRALENILIRNELIAYLVDLVRGTRTHESVLVGAGPRATQALIAASRVSAAMAGRDFVTPDDIRSMAVPVLGHRLILRPEFELEGLSVEEVIDQILKNLTVPR